MHFSRQEVTTGIPLFDNQHEQYFRTVEELMDRYKRGEQFTSEYLGEVLNKILEYAVENFDSEEQLMYNEDYPDYDEHKRKHDSFKDSMDGYLEELAEGADTLNFVERLSSLLIMWFSTQIRHDDVKLAHYLRERGHGAKSV